MSEPTFFINNKFILKGDIEWHYFSYKKLSKVLTGLVAKIRDNYHTGLINDYIGFIDELIKIDELCQINKNDMFDFHNDDSNGSTLKQLKEIRLHDFYLKRKYELLAFKIYSKLKENNKPLLAFNEKLDWNSFNVKQRVFVGFGMTRSLGLFDMKYRINNNLILGVQIQGEHFRLFIEDNSGEQAEKIKEKLLNDGLWFNFASSFDNPKIYPLESYKQNFNKYGKTFFYKSVKLGTDKAVDEIINIVLSYVDQIKQNLEQIENILTS